MPTKGSNAGTEKSPAPIPVQEGDMLQRTASEDGQVSDCSDPQVQRGLKPRHSQMIAIGGAIGTSLFVGTGQMLAIGGPAFLLLAFGILCSLMVSVVTALVEVATYLPIAGGTMSYYAHRYVSSSMGFALGYLYWYSMGILIPYEVTAASLVVDYWETDFPIAALITIMITLIVVLNLLPVSVYGETEFWFVSLKDQTTIDSASATGTTLDLSTTTSYPAHPQGASLPSCKPCAGNAFLYASSRSLYSLAVAGSAPRVFARCNRWGVPYVAIGTSAAFSLLSYLNVSSSSAVVFNWLVNLTNTSGFISWICCCVVFVRFRAATAAQHVQVPYRSFVQPYGAWFALGLSLNTVH
ncbi:AAT family amino acid transporter [Lasiodiplodia theobromae]|uniref:AAT family amino acid transporter n=1 Tax=Lasiodiplodia theobromae TaxID=45133 RepID=A0A8H7ISA5_9PEZI|nr:AAT family amino acid transporter [Lasiodiplodia theobromae]